MKAEDRKNIIEICKRNGIPYVGVVILRDKYEIKDCDKLCESCKQICETQKNKYP